MDSQDFYLQCLQSASSIVNQLQPNQLANPTIDDDWTVRDLVSHMMYEVSWVPDMVAGKTIAEVGDTYEGDLFDGDVANSQTNVKAAWELAANRAERAVEAGDMEATAHLSYADVTNADYVKMTGGDVLVHTWDLATAIGVPFSFPADVAADMWLNVKDRNLSGSGLFKASLESAAEADDQTKILAKFGRDSSWRPTA